MLSALFGGAALVVALAVKAFYSRAGADELTWVLAPSSWLARHAGGLDLAYERGAGFISHAHHLVVGAPCAGVNFLLVAFVALAVPFVSRFPTARGKAAWIGGAAIVAYAATIVTNAARIVISARLYELDVYGGVVTPERVHRLAGTVVYYGSLLGLFFAVEAVLGTRARRWVPLACYLAVCVGVPVAGRAFAAAARVSSSTRPRSPWSR